MNLRPPAHVANISVVDDVTILGITVANAVTYDRQYQMNFRHRLQMIKLYARWWNRNLSLKGKVVLINSLLISILQYPCTCTYTPRGPLQSLRP